MMSNKLAAVVLVLSGCATESDGAFHITGRLAEPSAASHAVAWNAITGERQVLELSAGELDLSVPVGTGWGLTFADARMSGAAMRVATLRAGELDVLQPASDGALDLGTISIKDGTATGTTSAREVASALGLDEQTADRMARIDDLARRFANPDIDNDGAIDTQPYMLELSGQYALQVGARPLDIADMVRGTQPTGLDYQGTTIIARAPHAMNMPTATFMFDEPFAVTGMAPEYTMLPAHQPIGYPHIKFGIDGSRLVGLVANPAHNVPTGTYAVGFGDGQLTFTDVYAPRASALAAATDHVIPTVRIRPLVAGCSSSCDIASIEVTWQRATPYGWEPVAAPAEAQLAIVADFNGKDISLVRTLTADDSAFSWQSMPIAGSGITRHELAYISSGELCYVAVRYTSELGMKMTSKVRNPACTSNSGSSL